MPEQAVTNAAWNNLAPIPMECDAPYLRSSANCRASSTARSPQRPQPAIRFTGRALVRRRRHAARLPSRERPRQLPQPLGPHPEMAGRA
jgi:hypothetical protein